MWSNSKSTFPLIFREFREHKALHNPRPKNIKLKYYNWYRSDRNIVYISALQVEESIWYLPEQCRELAWRTYNDKIVFGLEGWSIACKAIPATPTQRHRTEQIKKKISSKTILLHGYISALDGSYLKSEMIIKFWL